MSSDVGRARRLLARPRGWIEAAPDGYVLRVGRDRRTRVLLTVEEEVFRALAANPGLKIRPGGGWVARAVSTAPSPPSPEPGRPGVIEGARAVVEADGAVTSRRANLGQSAIVWLARRADAGGRPWLAPREIAAADRLARDAEAAMRGPAVTMRWDALPRSGAGGDAPGRNGPAASSMAAGLRVETALSACGPARGMVEAICIRSTALQAAERDLGLARRRGRALLQAGLAALADHYRIG
ncbi:DUF6456 domain-containing protein [Brevundimonas sp. Root1423]|uniref:DUF6456 domain-containing protein n=1 Tax=Brevundimonas sp. Root1423 TaxID=1736462 RepID=UPI0006F8CEDB|nr:DUF6456 domain-containing protein [Brevundimonas sp. Root1423]KQY84790.1 hypothetical protein ASD25_07150 [Brevundimonas sp. Root1423]